MEKWTSRKDVKVRAEQGSEEVDRAKDQELACESKDTCLPSNSADAVTAHCEGQVKR